MFGLEYSWDDEGFAQLEGTRAKPGPGSCRTLFQFYLPKPLLAFCPQINSNCLKSTKITTIQLSILYVVSSNWLDKNGLKFASAYR